MTLFVFPVYRPLLEGYRHLIHLLKVGLFLTISTFSLGVLAEESGPHIDVAPHKTDLASLQNGARLFVNYCLNCHSASYMRFSRLREIGISDQQIKDYLLFSGDKVGDLMQAAIQPKEAAAWFGAPPPDLTLVARSRAGHGYTGRDYLYTYLRSYYRDANRPTGWNNTVFPNVAMPHVLWELQGERQPIYENTPHGPVLKKWQPITPGLLTAEQYDNLIADLVAYLDWMAEPVKNTRHIIGLFILCFLFLFSLLAWKLNKTYWKEIK
jgi:ubiquinol-cytochrome c reductase cytochrome c1 subunit